MSTAEVNLIIILVTLQAGAQPHVHSTANNVQIAFDKPAPVQKKK